jgi:ribosomal protein S27E
MPDQHCPGFENNKVLKEIKVKCPQCGVEIEIFADEIDKKAKCQACGGSFDPQKCTC